MFWFLLKTVSETLPELSAVLGQEITCFTIRHEISNGWYR